MHSRLLLVGGCLGAVASARASRQPRTTYTNGSACAQVSSAAAALGTSFTATPIVDGQLAYDCLQSVPLGQPEALALMESIFPYVEWQTDVSYLKNPPPSYLEPAVDIWAELYNVYDKVKNHTYAGEYDFQADLFRVFNLAHDGHFRFSPDLLTIPISFSRNVSLVSVSVNGTDLPQVYVQSDIEEQMTRNFTASPLASINGQDAVTFLSDLGQLGLLGDADTNYNTLFYSKQFAAANPGSEGYFAGSSRFGYIWPGARTEIVFQNGTKRTYRTVAQVLADFTGVTDGESMYKKFCNPDPPAPSVPIPPPSPSSSPSPSPTSSGSSSKTTPTSVPGYPVPELVSSDGVISGYFLNSTRNSDVAVLSMLDFAPLIPAEFQSILQSFISQAKAAGRTKLVIDLSANGGGDILSGYDAFRQLFPQIEQDGFTRFRYTEAMAVMAQQYAAVIPADFDPDTASEDVINMYEGAPNYRFDVNLTDGQFTSVGDAFARHEYNGDNFSSIHRFNLNDPLATVNTTYGMGMEITGYGSRRNFTQPFAAEDIVLLYDGYCASTCTLFSEFMRIQAGVKSIAMGGLPSTRPIQGVAGTKGANNYQFGIIQYLAGLALETGTSEQQKWANWTALTDLNLLAVNRSRDNSVNVRDHILPSNLEEGLPAQFVYEAADCRLFYEPEMVLDVAATWEAAADAAWGNKPCVNGDLGLKKRSITEKRTRTRSGPVLPKRSIATFEPLQRDRLWYHRHGMKVPF